MSRGNLLHFIKSFTGDLKHFSLLFLKECPTGGSGGRGRGGGNGGGELSHLHPI